MWITITPNMDRRTYKRKQHHIHTQTIFISPFIYSHHLLQLCLKKKKKNIARKTNENKIIYLRNTKSHTQTWSEERVNQDTP